MDLDPDPKQEMHLIRNNQKIIKNKQFYNYCMTIKNVNLTFSLKSMLLRCHEKAFFIVGIGKERIFIVGSKTGSVTFTRGSES
jgi:hypothetical protein